MASLKARVTDRLDRLREQRPFVDHLIRMQGHYGAVKAGQQAGAVTYFGFLSFFPILALAVFVVGYVSQVYPAANGDLREVLDTVLPDLVGTGEGQIRLSDLRDFSGLAGVVGLVGVLYAGLGWVSALRDALSVVFDTTRDEQLGLVAGKLRDLLTLVVVGLVLIVSVAVTGLVSSFSKTLLELVGLGAELAVLVQLLAVVVGLASNTLLFYAMFRLLARPPVPSRSLWTGALLGALGFEVLKQLSRFLLASTAQQPAFQAFGIALILLVWINYFSRLSLYAAAFAHTGPQALEERAVRAIASGPDATSVITVPAPGPVSEPPGPPTGARDWKDGFVDRIDAADPVEVGPDSARAAREAREQHRAYVRTRVLGLGAAVGGAALAALAWARRGER